MNPAKDKNHQSITHDEISKCLDKAIHLLSPGSISRIIDEDKSYYKSPAITLLKNFCNYKKENNEADSETKTIHQQEANNELVNILYQIVNQSSDSPKYLSNMQTPITNTISNTQFLNNILQQPTTFKSNLLAGTYTNDFSISPVLYNNAAYNNEIHNIYSANVANFGQNSVNNIMNNPMTPMTGLPLNNYYYQGFAPQSINPIFREGQTPALNSPFHRPSSIDLNNLGISLIKLNQQAPTPSNTNIYSHSAQTNMKRDSEVLQSTQNSISLKDMIKKENIKKPK